MASMCILQSRKRSLAVSLIVVLIAGYASGKKKVNPDEFNLAARITEVSSQREIRDVTTTHPVLPDYCNNPQTSYQKSFCQTAKAGGDISTTTRGSVFVMSAEIGDRIYQLQGPRLELGDYRVRFTTGSQKKPPAVEFLLRNKKGEFEAVRYQVVGEKLKP